MYIDILVEIKFQNNMTFTYEVPNNLIEKIEIGKRVLVPFQNKKIEGFILNINNNKSFDYEIKQIIDVIDDFPVLSNELLNIGEIMSKQYLSSLISCYQVMLPKALKASNRTNIKIKEETYIVINKERNY